MAFEIKISKFRVPDASSDKHGIYVQYSGTDIASMMPEHILSEVVNRIADKFVEEHYAEIEKLIDPKLVAALVTASMGVVVEKHMMDEIERVQHIAQQALKIAKRAR
jgi:GGDEF domain-containing protein